MKMEVLKENENKLLHRKEIDVVIKDLASTPSKKDVLALISANLGVNEGSIVLGSLHQKYGKKEVRLHAKVYESEEHKKGIEPKPKEKKGEKQEEEKK